MSDSIRDQLLGLGFKPSPKPERQHEPRPANKGARRPEAGKPGAPGRSAPDARKPRHGMPQHGRPQQGKPQHGKPGSARPQAGQGRPQPPRSREEIDLAKAYAIRAQREKDERIEAERQKQAQARERREAKARLAELVKDQALNDPAADIARHFDYGGKIKRIHVTAAQLKALNAGELGVVQLDGRYLLVSAALLQQAEAIFAPAVALKVDPSAPVADDPYVDPKYQVPDDLVW